MEPHQTPTTQAPPADLFDTAIAEALAQLRDGRAITEVTAGLNDAVRRAGRP